MFDLNCVFYFYFYFYQFIFYGLNKETGYITIDFFTEPIGYNKEKRDIRIQGKENPSLHQLIKLWFLDNHPGSVCKRRLFGIDYTSIFGVDKNISNTKQPFGFETGWGHLTKENFLRSASWQKPIFRVGEKMGKDIEIICFGQEKSIGQKTENELGKKNVLGKKFILWIIFVMAISEHKENHKALKSKTAYKLKCPTVIVHYNFRWYTDLNKLETHDHSKSNKAFWPTMH